jgi:hypothetical protein
VPAAAIEGTARALREAATWVGAECIDIETVRPASAKAPLRASLRG